VEKVKAPPIKTNEYGELKSRATVDNLIRFRSATFVSAEVVATLKAQVRSPALSHFLLRNIEISELSDSGQLEF